ncbi:MAG: right-handed parallel beta-helix repeat-containing protein, partial [Acidimicrobiia bacterium]
MPAQAAVLTVDSLSDAADLEPGDGVCHTGEDATSTCTLRAAIQEANASDGVDTISFDFAGTAPHVITPLTDLPALGDGTVVDATLEPDYSGTPVVLLRWDPTTDADPGSAFLISGPGVVVRGLSITGWPGNAIHISSAGSNALVELNHVGVDPSGSVAEANGGQGISVFGADGATIRDNLVSGNEIGGILLQGGTNTTVSGNTVGTDLAGGTAIPNGIFGISVEAESGNTIVDANLVSGNPAYGIGVSGSSSNTTITSNLVGTNRAGNAAIPNGVGVSLNGPGSPTEIGPENLISGNSGNGITVSSPTAIEVFIEGNQIGTDADGGALGNGGAGVWADGSDLWIGSVLGNEIAFNAGAGIDLRDVASSLILANSIHDNGGLGIVYLEPAPVAPPVIDAVSTGDDVDTGPFVDVSGTISQPLTDFTIAVFANSVCDPSGFGEGERFLGTATVTNVEGTTDFSVRVDAAVAADEVVTALLSVPQGATSEFSECLTVEASPEPGGDVLYGVNSNDDGLSIIDPATGAVEFIGPLAPDSNTFTTPVTMGVHPDDGTLYVWNNSDPSGVLLTVDRCTGLADQIGEPPGTDLGAIAFAPDGSLYGLRDVLFSIDAATGALTQVSDGFGLRVGGADFSPDGVLYGLELSTPHRLVTIDTDTGAATEVARLSGLGTVGSIAFDGSGNLIGSGTGTTGSILFDIPLDVAPDPDTGTVAVTNVREITGGFTPQGMGFSAPCDIVGTVVVNSVGVDDTTLEAGYAVPLTEIPPERLVLAANTIAGAPMAAIDLNASPMGAIPMAAIPMAAIDGTGSLGQTLLSEIPIEGGWEPLLVGTPYEGRPLQTLTLDEVVGVIDPVILAQLNLSSLRPGNTGLSDLSIAALMLGDVPLSDMCGSPCPSQSALEIVTSGGSLATVPMGA